MQFAVATALQTTDGGARVGFGELSLHVAGRAGVGTVHVPSAVALTATRGGRLDVAGYAVRDDSELDAGETVHTDIIDWDRAVVAGEGRAVKLAIREGDIDVLVRSDLRIVAGEPDGGTGGRAAAARVRRRRRRRLGGRTGLASLNEFVASRGGRGGRRRRAGRCRRRVGGRSVAVGLVLGALGPLEGTVLDSLADRALVKDLTLEHVGNLDGAFDGDGLDIALLMEMGVTMVVLGSPSEGEGRRGDAEDSRDLHLMRLISILLGWFWVCWSGDAEQCCRGA